ncbi:hypothetical protein P7K49_028601 [Saguinus oedipus]|uniref:Uncharacterized protein n=1 Tax=Saguinus oedipus TaxID=9490 RepID=A0ABQ9U4T6_SAGOE|nr:hypothetical protein P7K49_028601 [Saguinus oedipus]
MHAQVLHQYQTYNIDLIKEAMALLCGPYRNHHLRRVSVVPAVEYDLNPVDKRPFHFSPAIQPFLAPQSVHNPNPRQTRPEP